MKYRITVAATVIVDTDDIAAIAATAIVDTGTIDPEYKTELLSNYQPTDLAPEPDDEWLAIEYVLDNVAVGDLTVTDVEVLP